MNNPLILLLLIWVHCMGDMVFQTGFMARFKSKKFAVMLMHITVWTGTVCLVLYFAGLFKVWHIIFLALIHLGSDSWKSRQPKDEEHFWCIYADQLIHLVQMVVVWL